MSYPKHKYAPTGGSVLVTDHAHERMLGEGWSDNPPAPVEVVDEPETEMVDEPAATKKTSKKKAV